MNEESQKFETKACPFCGGETTVGKIDSPFTGYRVTCQKRGCPGNNIERFYYATPGLAARNWNESIDTVVYVPDDVHRLVKQEAGYHNMPENDLFLFALKVGLAEIALSRTKHNFKAAADKASVMRPITDRAAG